jgi:hypothetical protein
LEYAFAPARLVRLALLSLEPPRTLVVKEKQNHGKARQNIRRTRNRPVSLWFSFFQMLMALREKGLLLHSRAKAL